MAFYNEDNNSFEIFFVDEYMCEEWNVDIEDEDDQYQPGYYFQFCFPGCMPDSDPFGPYQNEEICLKGAKEYIYY